MNTRNVKLGLVATVLLSGLSTNAEVSREQLSRISTGNDVVAFEMYWPQRSAKNVADRTAALAEVMIDEKILTDDVTGLLSRNKSNERVTIKTLNGAPNLAFAYLPQFDEIRIINEEMLNSADPDNDIGQVKAIDTASQALKRMAKAGLLDAKDYNPALAQVGFRKVAGGTVDGITDYSHIVEYRVTFRRVLNGIEMANSGVRIGVHTNGGISSVRLGGVEVAQEKKGDVSLPGAKGKIHQRTVSRNAIAKRFSAQQPKEAQTRVAYNKLMYVMPEDTQRAIVNPTEVYAFSLAFASDTEAKAISRRQIVGYDVTDEKALVNNYTKPDRSASDEGIRQ